MKSIYQNLAKKTTHLFIRNGIIDEEKTKIYTYCFEILFSTIVYTSLFFLVANITNTLLPSLIFWISFLVIRSLCGGYHANTYMSCHILFMTNHILFILLYKLTPEYCYSYIASYSLLFSSVVILLCAPVDHQNKPFIKNEEKRFSVLSKAYGSMLCCMSVITIIFCDFFAKWFALGYAGGSISAAIAILSAKFVYMKGDGKNEKTHEDC